MSDQYAQCFNCGIVSWRRNPSIGLYQIQDERIRSVIQQWVVPEVVKITHDICQECRDLAINSLGEQISSSTTGHRQVCVNCERSVLRAISHLLHTDTEREKRIRTVICEWVSPRTILSNRALICHRCWVRADREAKRYISVPSGFLASLASVDETTNQQSATRPIEASIELTDYKRAVETESRCFIEGCKRRERNRVPAASRKMLLDLHKLYVPKNNRLCNHHIDTQSPDFLTEALKNYVNVFTAMHIQDMLELKNIQYPDCGPNEVYECALPCPPEQTCRDRTESIECVEEVQSCELKCVCQFGFYRNTEDGVCISEKQCAKCPGAHEHYACGDPCDNVCNTLHLHNRTSCPYTYADCNPSCYCDDGYARDDGGVCIQISECPPPKCGQNEEYTDCKPSCSKETCSSIVSPPN